MNVVPMSGSTNTPTGAFSPPIITPPSPDSNPNIVRPNMPPGTVFLVVGAAAAAVFAAIIIWYLITEHISRRETKKSHYESVEKRYDEEFSSPDTELFDSRFEKKVSSPVCADIKPRLMLEPHVPSLPLFSFAQVVNTPLDRYPNSDEEKRLEGQRQAMYISPTVEVMNQKRMRHTVHDMNIPVFSLDDHTFKPPEIATPNILSAAAVDRRVKNRSKNRYAVNPPLAPLRPSLSNS